MKCQKGGKHFVKKTLFLLILLVQTAFAYPPLPEARTESEALFVRRILDFLREKEYPFAKSQIRAYMSSYPEGPFTDHFFAMLGDIALHEKDYSEALDFYARLSDSACQTHVRTKKWQALYQLQRYSELHQEMASIGPQEINEEGTFYFAEAAFRKGLFEEALPLYSSLMDNQVYGGHAKLALAEIYRFLKRPEMAADLYLEIAEDHDKKLFYAAAMFLHFDQEKAAELFEQIAHRDSENAQESAYQWLQILAQQGEWKKIEKERSLWLTKIAQEHNALAYFYLGMIAFEQAGHFQAIADLQKALEKGITSPHDRSALEALLTSAKEVGNLDLCESSYTLLTERYPQLQAEAGYMRALAYQKTGDTARALVYFNELIHHFPMAGVEKIKLLMDEKRLEEAHESICQFLELYPLSARKEEMLRLAIDISQIQMEFEKLAEDLAHAFTAQIFEGDERVEMETLLVKTYIKLGHIHGALGLLHEMHDPDPLLFTQCYIKAGNAPDKVVYFGERALENTTEHERLHLHLFNAYLQLAKSDSDETLTLAAATHLNSVIDFYPVSLENRLWLAHYFVKSQNPRAIDLLESLLLTEANWKRFDEEGLILARLYQKQGALKKAKPLAERVISLRQDSQPEAELILAEILQELGEREKAEELFAHLAKSPHLPITYAATLHLARIRFESDPEQSLKGLYSLKMRKTLDTEPIHLEAALDHAEFQASLYPENEQTKFLLAALLEVREEFMSEEDICSKDYHESRLLMPEKEQIYQAYMYYLDACIYNLQAKITSNTKEKKAKQHAARALFTTLCEEKYAVSNYLIERVTAGMYEQ